jgi:hypothetical protein
MVAYGRSRNPGKIDPAALGVVYQSVVESLSPVAYWPMQEDSGTTMTALAGSSGTYSGGTTLGVTGPTATIPRGVQFDGTNDYASASLDLSAYSAVTVSGWMFIPSGAPDDKIPLEHTANWNTNNAFGWYPRWNNGYWGVVTSGSSGQTRNIGVSRPSVDTWHHYLTQHPRDNSYPTIWIDGVKVTSIPHTVSSGSISGSYSNSTLYLGARAGTSGFCNYRMSQVAVFGSILSDADCAKLYTAAL